MNPVRVAAIVLIVAGGLVLIKPEPSALEPPIAATLDLKTLEQQLKDTKAIGFFTKITLKNQVDEDQKLASAIVSSREAIWALLADPITFATLEG